MDIGHIIMSLDEIYQDVNAHLVTDSIPSIYLSHISERLEFREPPFLLLYQLKFTEQSIVHHPEGNVWNHTLLVVDEAAKRKNLCMNPSSFMWAALLHDIGKPSTTQNKNGKITSYNHDKIGATLARDFLSIFTKDQFFIESVCTLIEFHMHILYVTKKLPYADIPKMLEKADINELALFGLCDLLGRKGASPKEAESTIKHFIKKGKTLEKRNYNQKIRNMTD